MPLRDHFRSPIDDRHSWDEIHGGWPMELVRQIRELLPHGYRAVPQIHLGSPFEVDVGTYDEEHRDYDPDENRGDGGTATLARLAPTYTAKTDFPEQDEYEVRVYDENRVRTLVATLEIISPSNLDRPNNRERFIGKVTALLQQDVCVSLIDLVTTRRSNLYAELLAAFDQTDPSLGAIPPALYAVTLKARTTSRRQGRLDIWYYPMTVGQPLPTIPIWLTADLRVDLPLEVGYEEACLELRIPALYT